MSQEINSAAQEEQFGEVQASENTIDTNSQNEPADISQLSLKEILQLFEELLQRGDQQEMYKNADVIKAAFYKALKREKIASGVYTAPEESVINLSEDVQNDEEQSTSDSPEVENSEEAEGSAPVSVNPFAEIERIQATLYTL